MSVSDRVIAISVGAFAAVAYLVAGAGLATDYDYFGRLAAAFLAGHWWLDEAPSWLNELIACGDGRWCVVYPPLPAILSLPFAPFVPSAYAQVLASRVAGGASAAPLYLALRAYGAPKAWSIAGTLLSAFGTTLFFSSVDGRAWYAAHAARRRVRPPHRGRCLLHAGPLLAALPAATARRAVPRAARYRPGHAVLPHPALRRHEPLPHDAGVPVDLSRASRGAPRRGRG